MRDILGGVVSTKQVDVEGVLSRLGVGIHDISLDTTELDAVAIFGPRHGPAILINEQGRHASAPVGRRASLAHELCHLLVDRKAALPAAEVLLRGKGPRRPEQRANAFAAEFLVPGSEVLNVTRNASPQTRADWVTIVDTIARSFGASHAVVGWQILNAHEAAGEAIPMPAAGWLQGMARSPSSDS
jgi:Zn-dependent peptidase ImmA (M78 family)